MTWWQKQLLKFGIYYYSLKEFRWPPRVGQIKEFQRRSGITYILIYYKVGRKFFFKQLEFSTEGLKPFTEIAPHFLIYIRKKEIFFRGK